MITEGYAIHHKVGATENVEEVNWRHLSAPQQIHYLACTPIPQCTFRVSEFAHCHGSSYERLGFSMQNEVPSHPFVTHSAWRLVPCEPLPPDSHSVLSVSRLSKRRLSIARLKVRLLRLTGLTSN